MNQAFFTRQISVGRVPWWMALLAIILAFALLAIAIIAIPLILIYILISTTIRAALGSRPTSTFGRDPTQLVACPLCGLCVQVIPESGACPECGTRYDDPNFDHDDHGYAKVVTVKPLLTASTDHGDKQPDQA